MANPYYHDGTIMGGVNTIEELHLTTPPPAISRGLATVDLSDLPSDILVLSPRRSMFLRPPANLPPSAIRWQSSSFTLWQPGDADWACVVHVETPGGLEADGDTGWMWLASGQRDTVLKLYASSAGTGRLQIHMQAGPSLPQMEPIHVVLLDSRGSEQQLELPTGSTGVDLPLAKGANIVRLKLLNPDGGRNAGHEVRPVAARLGIEGITIIPAR
jgi:hypothetical protein